MQFYYSKIEQFGKMIAAAQRMPVSNSSRSGSRQQRLSRGKL